MNEKSVNEQYSYICTLLAERRLKEALIELDAFLWMCSDWTIRTQLEQAQTSYNYMLQYMREGVEDPERWKLHKKLMTDAWEIADRARIYVLDGLSTHYYHEVRSIPRSEELKDYNLEAVRHILESFNDDLAVSQFVSDAKKMNVLKRHESTLKYMFLSTWTNSAWDAQESEHAQAMLTSELLPTNDACLFVSAVTLSAMECFDLKKLTWLLEAYQHANTQINQRALVGITILLHFYKERIALYPELTQRIDVLNESPSFADDVVRVYKQLLLCQETEKIDRKMREEIIPEMLKNVSSFRNMRFGPDENEEEKDDINPDWEKAFEDTGLSDKLREMNELQLEGADIYMSTFSQLKGYPFFREVQNWFYPFDKRQSNVMQEAQQDVSEKSSVLDLILQSGFFCNNDKYSLFFTIQQLPQSQREMMLSQLTEQQMEEFTEQTNAESLKAFSERPSTISSQYLHDLYRFFKLNVRRSEFRDIFKEKLDLYTNPILSPILYSDQYLLPIADFYLRKERWQEAIDIYKHIEYADRPEVEAPIFYQKMGYVLQKVRNYKEAIEAYLRADTILPDNIWTIRHLAICYRLTRNYEQALAYYKKVEEVNSEDTSAVFYIASCLAELGRYEESLNYFFKLDFLENDSIKAWRGIGWCSFISKKYEQAMRYYEKVLQGKPLAIDYMNAGHAAWCMNEIDRASGYYEKARALSDTKERFLEFFRKDKETLLEQGIREEDIPLMLDLI
ncbi:tetratricopeptide repeat protein [Bacteroides reticulotermitis]|uniref:tetratricopeptide repeat protein n=1 Tax=Bacteroides reticulotermitis TaxID=1133319 RepID=UPI003A83CEF8